MADGFTFEPSTGRYRNRATGRYVPEAALRDAVERLTQAGQARIAVLSERLATGQFDVLAWREAMRQEIKTVWTASAALAHGGLHHLDPSTRGWLGARLREQYSWLDLFALDIAQGRIPLDGRFAARAGLYAEAASHSAYHAMRRRDAAGRGMAEERNLLGGSQHCPGCVTETGRGWQPLGALVPIGARDCVSRCRCRLAFRAPRPARVGAA